MKNKFRRVMGNNTEKAENNTEKNGLNTERNFPKKLKPPHPFFLRLKKPITLLNPRM